MRFLHAMGPVIAGALFFLATGATPLFSPPKSGLTFYGVTDCPQHEHLTFAAVAPNGLPPDTLCSDVITGELLWDGGPVRGLCTRADTAYVAVLLGFFGITPDTTTFTPWPIPQGERLPDWTVGPGSIPATRIQEGEQPFPERYRKQPDGTVVFLVDGESPPNFNRRWHDLHLRSPSGTEWLAARNLLVQDWVLNDDESHWALVAKAWVPDYGGQEKVVLLAGTNQRVERFELGPLEYAVWDAAHTLWVVNQEGQLIRIQPRENAWSMERVSLPRHHCGTPPAGSDSVWTWVWPEPFSAYNAARAFASRHGQGWVAHADSTFWACWTGFNSAGDLERSWPQAPVEGVHAQAMDIRESDFLGTARHFRSRALSGEASLMYVLKNNTRLSELWWRYPGQTRVRLAGPWPIEAEAGN